MGVANLEWKTDGSDADAAPVATPGILAAMAERIAVLADRIIDTARGEVVVDRAVVLEDDRIVDVVATADVPDGPRRIELPGHTVLPGLMDMHSHLAGEEESGQGYASLVMRSGAQDAIVGVRNARLVAGGGLHHRARRRFVPRVHRRRDPRGDRGGVVPRSTDAVFRRLRHRARRFGRHHRPGGRRRCGRPGRAAVRRDGRCGPDARQRPADPREGRGLHQGARDRRGLDERHEPGRAGVHRGRAHERPSKRVRTTARSSPPTRTARSASGERCGRACARSSTPR